MDAVGYVGYTILKCVFLPTLASSPSPGPSLVDSAHAPSSHAAFMRLSRGPSSRPALAIIRPARLDPPTAEFSLLLRQHSVSASNVAHILASVVGGPRLRLRARALPSAGIPVAHTLGHEWLGAGHNADRLAACVSYALRRRINFYQDLAKMAAFLARLGSSYTLCCRCARAAPPRSRRSAHRPPLP